MKPNRNKKEFAMNDDSIWVDALENLVADDSLNLNIILGKNSIYSGTSASVSQIDEVVQGLSGAKISTQVFLVDVRWLEPYPDQPFQAYPQEQLVELSEDIKRVGVLSPILARKNKKHLQILAGHNRWNAAKLAGLKEVPVMILDVDDDQAALVVTSTNLRQREGLLPSEKAFAYQLQMEALKRQGQRRPEEYNAAALITEQTGDSRAQIHRYIRLTALDQTMLDLLDHGRISMTPAVTISYLPACNQKQIATIVKNTGISLTIEKSNALKHRFSTNGSTLSEKEVKDILLDKSEKSLSTIKIKYKKISEYLPQQQSNEEIEQYIINALKAYSKTLDN